MTADNSWQPCEPGTILEIAQKQKLAERQHTITRRAVFSTVLCAVGGIAYSFANRGSFQQTRLTCAQTMALAEQYVSGQLNAPQVDLFDAHLSKCPKCAKLVAKLNESRQA